MICLSKMPGLLLASHLYFLPPVLKIDAKCFLIFLRKRLSVLVHIHLFWNPPSATCRSRAWPFSIPETLPHAHSAHDVDSL